MKKPAEGKAGGTGGAEVILADDEQTRMLVTHCPDCLKPYAAAPSLWCEYSHDRLKQTVTYGLCKRCAVELQANAEDEKWYERKAERIGRNLAQLGAFIGIERDGLSA